MDPSLVDSGIDPSNFCLVDQLPSTYQKIKVKIGIEYITNYETTRLSMGYQPFISVEIEEVESS